ncbi:hypothetical protein Nepgr_027584 [Nepenthes gracilis]|uniref:3'-5' exonuclease domain-containing protein n=1 Tax=Nepenthes gracilis TaxID=150966 RepID=A0AAD3Y3P5_NEPGR|nr:hypothetical protein Nepgr_027584 [Nepenthes gracilis]
MSDRSTYRFTIQNKDVRTTVVSTGSELDNSLGKLLSTIGAERQMKRLVGINIQKVHTPLESGKLRDKVAVLTLCSGLSCLVIHLLHFRTIPSSIAAFFELPEISFVGVGIKHCVDALERDYGIGCRNAFDLGQLFSINKEEPKLSALGLGDLAYKSGMFDVGVTAPSAVFSDWGADRLNSEQIKYATTTAFMAFFVGNRLLGGLPP